LPTEDLSLVDGGPLYHLLRRMGMAGPAGSRALVRAVLLAALAWIPLLALAAARGQAIGDSVRMPFLTDFSTYTRFLIALPLLVLAEAVIDPWARIAARHFVATGIVKDEELPRFNAAVRRAWRVRDSVAAEIAIIILAWSGAWLGLHMGPPISISHWYGTIAPSGRQLEPAGWYYALVSIPIFQLLIYKWVWRLIVWSVFLASVSRLDLRLPATHPDGAAGLGFLDLVTMRFVLIVLAGFTALAGVFGNAQYHAGAPLSAFAGSFFAFLLVALAICIGPNVSLIPKLMLARSKGVLEYGQLARQYMALFEEKWVNEWKGRDDSILGTPDIQSMADIGHASEVVENMRLLPVRRMTITLYVAAAVLPMLPLIMAEMGVGKVMGMLLGIGG